MSENSYLATQRPLQIFTSINSDIVKSVNQTCLVIMYIYKFTLKSNYTVYWSKYA